MYQTVGQDAIQLVAQALDVPIYRTIISGSAVEQGSEYGDRSSSAQGVKGDETEDLFNLLSTVKVSGTRFAVMHLAHSIFSVPPSRYPRCLCRSDPLKLSEGEGGSCVSYGLSPK
jgi:diphthamide synthase (EF-2-diphthine--ammonia ligase)